MAAPPGTDGALAMAMGHVTLNEFYVEREVPYFADYARRFTASAAHTSFTAAATPPPAGPRAARLTEAGEA